MHPVSTIQRWWPPLLWAGLILGMSSVPGSQLDQVGVSIPDKLVHFVEYTVFGALACHAARGRGARQALIVAILLGAALGALDENYQRLTPQRETSAADWTADLLGSFTGAVLVASRHGRASRAKRRSG